MIPLEWMPPLMFGGLVVFMIIGYPVAFSLCAVGFFFGFLSIEMGYFTMAFMQAIPGAILASIVAPSALAAGPAEAMATALTALCAWRFGNLPLAMGVGVGAVLALRLVMG